MNALFKHFILKPRYARNFINRCPSILRGAKTRCEEPKLMDTRNKIVVITGGCGGVGLTIAKELINQNVKKVALLDVNPDVGLKTVNNIACVHGANKAIFLSCDVSQKKAVQDCFKCLSEYLDGKFDILINAAGVWNDLDWENELNTNLIGVINTNIVAPCYMNPHSLIINISGLNAFQIYSHSPMLSASFSGIVAATRCFGSTELVGPSSTRIVCVCLGLTKTHFIMDSEQRQINAEMGDDVKSFLDRCLHQNTDSIKGSINHIIKYANTSTVWVAADNKLYSLFIPSWKCNACQEAQFIE